MSQPESDLLDLEDEDALEALAEFESVTGETSLNEAKFNFKKAKKLVFPNPLSSSPPGVPDRSVLFTSEGEHNGHSGFPASSPTNYKSFQTHESDEDDELLVMSVSQNHPMDYESNHQQHSLDLLPPSDVEEFISQGTFDGFNSQTISIDGESIPVSPPTSQLASDLIPMERSSSIDIRPDPLHEKELPLDSTLTDVSISRDTEEESSKLNTSSIPPQEPKMSTNFLFLSDDEEDDEIPPGQDSHHPNLRNLNTGKLGGLFATNFTQPNLSTFQFPKNPDNKFEDTLDSQNTNVSLFPDSQPSQYSLDSSEVSIPIDNKDKGKGKEKENAVPEPTSLFMDIPEDLDDPDLQEMYTYPGESEEYQELLSLEKEATLVNPKKRILDDNDFAISVAELETTGEAIESIKTISPPRKTLRSKNHTLDKVKVKRTLTPHLSYSKDYTEIPETGAFVSATTAQGASLFFSHKTSSYIKPQHQYKKLQSGNLLSTSIYRIMDEIDDERFHETRHSSLNSSEDSENLEDKIETELWVNKYAPTRFTELVGDDRLNLQVLTWLKEWDYCVFKKGPKPGKKSFTSNEDWNNSKLDPTKKPNDLYGRPYRKILLLTGPPGLGKTTLAHIIGKTAGYNIVEVNASDDRTGTLLKSKLVSATEMKSVLGDKRPNLLVIDEIDGVAPGSKDQGFINLLVDTITAGSQPGEPAQNNGKKKRKGKNHRPPLLRPIICICNDQYAPVLRPLRTIAQIHVVRPCPTNRLIDRLTHICQEEDLIADSKALNALCEMTEGDLRSCLNTLQFLKRKTKHVTIDTLSQVYIGRKDMSKSLFTVWDSVFLNSSKHRKTIRFNSATDDFCEHGNEGELENRYVNSLISLVHTNNEYDKLIQGVFHNYLNQRFYDGSGDKLHKAGEWLFFYDQMNASIWTSQHMELYGYLAYPIVGFHPLFSSTTRPYIEYPNKQYETDQSKRLKRNIIEGIMSNLRPITRRNFTMNSISMELLSPLLRIISPELKSVNSQLLRNTEKDTLDRLIELMIGFGLSYVQEKVDEAGFVYRLEPPLEKLIDLSTFQATTVLINRYAVRQLISQHIDMEIVRRKEKKLEKEKENQADSKTKTPMKREDNMITSTMTTFFVRKSPHNNKSNTLSLTKSPKNHQKPLVWYKFHQGLSDAVRKPMYVKDWF